MIEDLGDWRRTHWSSEILPELNGREVIVCGWVQRIRKLGKLIFIVLRDREGTLQITAHQNKVNPDLFEKLKKLKNEYVIAVKGIVKESAEAKKGVEILPEEIKVLNTVKFPLPLDPTGKVPAEIDTRLDARILDLRRPTTFAIFKIRHITLQGIREFFVKNGFIEVNTPKIIATASEGGTELFPVSYFERVAYLAQSPQLYKEELTAVFEKVFEIG
ncbi:MAG: amino acid--tRNA ligase-related protein, partial [Candidatus Baldrarchaeia archaeon]